MTPAINSLLEYLLVLSQNRDMRARGLKTLRALTSQHGAVPTRDALRNLIVRGKVPLEVKPKDIQQFVSDLIRGGEGQRINSHQITPRAVRGPLDPRPLTKPLQPRDIRALLATPEGDRKDRLIAILRDLTLGDPS